MKNDKIHFGRKLFFLILILTITRNGYGQYDTIRLNELKSKYPWGNIYITYISLVNLNSLLSDQKKRDYISKFHGSEPTEALQSFLTINRNIYINESIAFIEIDLNRIQAGYKRASDPGGEITQIAWSKPTIVKIAELFDRQLNTVSTITKTLKLFEESKVQIIDAFAMVQQAEQNPYTAPEAFYLVTKAFNSLLFRKEVELAKLKQQKPEVYSSIESFKVNFNDSYTRFQTGPLSKDINHPISLGKYNFGSLKVATDLEMLWYDSKPFKINLDRVAFIISH